MPISLSDGVLRNVKILRRFSEKNKDLGEFFGQPVQRKRRPAVFRPADPVRVHRRPTAVFRPKKKGAIGSSRSQEREFRL